MRKSILQFLCTECQKEVFRISSKINPELKLCGKCNKYPNPEQNIDVKTSSRPSETLIIDSNTFDSPEENNVSQVKVDTVVSKSLFNEEIIGKIRMYQLLLSKVIDLILELKEDHEETFLTLWIKAKKSFD